MLARGATPYDVAKLLGDEIATIEKHYAPFVRELRERVRNLMETGRGIHASVSRCSGSLRCRSPALSDPGSGSQRESGIRHRLHQENGAQGDALRELAGSARVSRSLGRALGQHSYPCHHQTPGCRMFLCLKPMRETKPCGQFYCYYWVRPFLSLS